MKSSILLTRMLAVGIAACALLGSFDASARTLDEIIASKKIVFGINPNLPPLGIYDAKKQHRRLRCQHCQEDCRLTRREA
ncbi:hypothetical protein [Paraburkholderia sp. BL23I1N1]|uniref:hypothetical protein n=1 Tax=Paraburkholderia sp. BL23I1N1 TaxID=1938802 RepID=UPI00217DC857|nr:hypothetical protein [Paraburkholderia sp. BL23I1N1]